MFGALLALVFRDHELQEQLVEASGLDPRRSDLAFGRAACVILGVATDRRAGIGE